MADNIVKFVKVEFWDFTTHSEWEDRDYDATQDLATASVLGWLMPSDKDVLVVSSVLGRTRAWGQAKYFQIIPRTTIKKITTLPEFIMEWLMENTVIDKTEPEAPMRIVMPHSLIELEKRIKDTRAEVLMEDKELKDADKDKR